MVPNEARLVCEEMAGDEPVSPTGQYLNSSVLSVCVLAVLEFDDPIDVSSAKSTLENLFLPINPRFSSIMVTDERGMQQWKRVSVKLEDHVIVPVFPMGQESYDEHVQDYLSKIATGQLPQSRPLWEMHIINYPTNNVVGTVVFKLHHALGDGFSLMGALFSCLKRADDLSLPLTFPSSRAKPATELRWCSVWRVPYSLSVCINTVRDFGWSFLKSNMLEDDRTPVRSGEDGVEFRPISISSATFSLDDIWKIKAELGGTVNDVITGVVFYGTQLYIEAMGHGTRSAEVTALVLLNTRTIGNYQTLQEMSKPDASKAPWGNHFAFLHVPIPQCNNAEKANPLHFVIKARQVIKVKRSSFATHLTGRLLELLRKIKGPEEASQYLYKTLKNTSMTISNLIGPIEQMILGGHRVRSLYWILAGAPQSLSITVFSYMGKVKVAVGAQKGFIDSELLISCMEKSFHKIFEAAVGKRT